MSDVGAVLLEIAGFAGMILILGAYALLSLRKIKPTSRTYQVMNLIGSLFLILYSINLFAWASVVLNVIWAIIAVFALSRMFRRQS